MKFTKLHSIIFIANCTINIESSGAYAIQFKVGNDVGASFTLFGTEKRNNIVAENLLLIRYPQSYQGYGSSSSIYFNEGLLFSSYVSSTIDSVSYTFKLVSGTIDIYTKYYY